MRHITSKLARHQSVKSWCPPTFTWRYSLYGIYALISSAFQSLKLCRSIIFSPVSYPKFLLFFLKKKKDCYILTIKNMVKNYFENQFRKIYSNENLKEKSITKLYSHEQKRRYLLLHLFYGEEFPYLMCLVKEVYLFFNICNTLDFIMNQFSLFNTYLFCIC